MVKFKPHKGLKKRFRVTANGKVVRPTAGKSKLMSHKSGRRCQRLRKKSLLNAADTARALRALGWKAAGNC